MPTTDASRAVFLSYASEDAEAAQRIATALAAAGIEVWFDRNELRGGDAWDLKIRQQIHDCRLFVAVVSARTQARDEGYFRREWKLAVDRSLDMADDRAFLVPVSIDATNERTARVPDAFKRVQWTRLPDGHTPAEFVHRIGQLLSPGSPDTSTGERVPLAKDTAHNRTAMAPRGRARRSAGLLITVVGMLAALAVGYATLHHAHGTDHRPASNDSIAVLPLANLSRDPEQQYFSDGLSESLISALAQIPQLKVIGKTSSFMFRDSKESAQSIGEKLGVTRLLEGSVQRSADQVRVSAELINTADGTTVWSEKYDRPYKDLFALQDEITRAVAQALKAKLLPSASASAQDERPPSGNLEAYNELLRGRFYLTTEDDNRKAIDAYTRATQLDPTYALAWSELAYVWANFAGAFLGDAAAQQAAFGKAHDAAQRALELAPQLAAAHIAQGYLLQVSRLDWRGAEAEFRQALALAPRSPLAQESLGMLRAALGDLQAAIELTQRALTSEPLRANWYVWLGTYYLGLNRLDEAEQMMRKAVALQPGGGDLHENLAIVLILRGQAAAALAVAEQETDHDWRDIAIAMALQVGADRKAADAALRAVVDTQGNVAAYQIAQIYALRGDADATFQWLDRAWQSRDSGLIQVLYDPLFARFKTDPRFAAYCRKAGLPAPIQ